MENRIYRIRVTMNNVALCANLTNPVREMDEKPHFEGDAKLRSAGRRRTFHSPSEVEYFC